LSAGRRRLECLPDPTESPFRRSGKPLTDAAAADSHEYLARDPYANYILIALNIVIFFLSYSFDRQYPFRIDGNIIFINGHMLSLPIRPWAMDWILLPGHWRYWQFLSYAFLHGSLLHIIGNMFFLYLFGANINDKLGHIRYVLFYLTGAIVSGAGFALLHPSSLDPTLGASGAIAAVTGAYLVLFPDADHGPTDISSLARSRSRLCTSSASN
jgi:membrane associated rhomboid family serine protease